MTIPKKLLILIPALLLAVLDGCVVNASKDKVTILEVGNRPNIIIIIADDLDDRLGTIQYMPNLKKYMIDRGVTLQDFLVTTPMCCPSRINLLRAQYTHNHQVFNNSAPFGGFPKFYETSREASTLAVWLQSAGYRTALIGKYLNAYPDPNNRTYIPPGWTEWYSPGRKNAYDGYDYYLNENGTLVPYGLGEKDYFTDVMNRKSTDFIKRASKDGVSFFLYLAPFVPHEPAVVARRHEDLLPSIQAPRTPSFNEEDMSDKSLLMSSDPLLTLEDEGKIDEYYRNRVLSMLAVDELIADLFKTLETAGQMENTYVIFTSDQGFSLGQHRVLRGKFSLYDEDIIVPFIVRGADLPEGVTIDPMLAGMVDIAPTIAEWGGVVPPEFVDGRSLVSVISSGKKPSVWREGFLLEQYTASGAEEESYIPEGMGFLAILPDLGFQQAVLPHSAGIRTLQYAYMEHPDGYVEFYDLLNDPYQMENIAYVADPQLVEQFSNWLSQLKTCRERACLQIEEQLSP